MVGEISKPLILSTVIHAVALGGLLVVAPYLSAPKLSLPPAQMVQLVDLPSGGTGGGHTPIHDMTPSTPKKPAPTPEAPKADNPPEPKPPEPKPEKAENPPSPKPKESPHTPEMALPAPKPKEPPKREPPKREEKKPEATPRAVVEKPPEKKKEMPPPTQTPPAPAPRREATARAQPERSAPGSGGRPGPGSGPGSSLALGGGSGMLSLDSANFPFTYYLRQVTGRIEENWIRPQQNLGRVVVYFQIKRDGSIIEPQIQESSRNQAADLLASGAIKRSEPFPPLPVEFGGDHLGIYLCFGLGGLCPGQKEG
ncbi:MAG TPA: TonB C-terminal domain-containing protein [Candidatus Tectomicrobia bacterium]